MTTKRAVGEYWPTFIRRETGCQMCRLGILPGHGHLGRLGIAGVDRDTTYVYVVKKEATIKWQ